MVSALDTAILLTVTSDLHAVPSGTAAMPLFLSASLPRKCGDRVDLVHPTAEQLFTSTPRVSGNCLPPCEPSCGPCFTEPRIPALFEEGVRAWLLLLSLPLTPQELPGGLGYILPAI